MLWPVAHDFCDEIFRTSCFFICGIFCICQCDKICRRYKSGDIRGNDCWYGWTNCGFFVLWYQQVMRCCRSFLLTKLFASWLTACRRFGVESKYANVLNWHWFHLLDLHVVRDKTRTHPTGVTPYSCIWASKNRIWWRELMFFRSLFLHFLVFILHIGIVNAKNLDLESLRLGLCWSIQ